MNIRNKKAQILFVILVIALLTSIVVLLANRNPSSNNVNDLSGRPVSGMVDPGNALLDVTTQSDFIDIQNRLMDYLAKQGAKTSLKVIVSDVEPPIRDGSILKFNITIPDINQKNIPVEVDYLASPAATFSIPSKQFKMPLAGEEN